MKASVEDVTQGRAGALARVEYDSNARGAFERTARTFGVMDDLKVCMCVCFCVCVCVSVWVRVSSVGTVFVSLAFNPCPFVFLNPKRVLNSPVCLVCTGNNNWLLPGTWSGWKHQSTM